jgi:branched-chain amino acid transport system substrate-binding protein
MIKRSMRTKTLLATLFTISVYGVAHAQKSEITIGFVNPTTGVFGTLGKYARKGMDLALEQAQKAPAFKGVTFKVIERDSAAKTPDAIRYARELVNRDQVDVLMGGLSSAECLSLEKLAAEIQTAYLPTSGCWADEFSDPANVNKYSFRVTANNKQRNQAFAHWLMKTTGKRWYVVYSDFAYGQSGLKAFGDAIKTAGGTLVGSVGVPFGTTDMAPYMSKIDKSAEGLYFVLAGRDAILALQEAASQGLGKKMKFAGMHSLVVPENFPKMPESAEGLSFIGAYARDMNGALDTLDNRKFRAAYMSKYPNDIIGLNSFEAYQATNMLLAGIEKSGFRGRKDTERLVAALSGLSVKASELFPAGPVTMRSTDHQGVAPLYIVVVKGGKEEVIHTISATDVAKIK